MNRRKTLMIESCEKKFIAEDFSNTSIVHVRNSKILERELGYKLITHISQIPEVLSETYDNIICHYASPYMKYKAYLEVLKASPSATMYFFVNDHDLEDNILLRNYIKENPDTTTYSVICNNNRHGYRHWILGKNICERKLNDFMHRWFTLNLNSLIYQDVDGGQANDEEKSGVIYYGTFRKHRADDMRAFNGIENYTISTSAKNQSKYTDAGITATKFIDKIGWTMGGEDLRKYKYSIYFEDLWTHTNFACLANRFYECLMCDTLMFFDKKCDNTIKMARMAGYEICDSLIAEDAKELNYKIKLLEDDETLYRKALDAQSKNKAVAQKERAFVLNKINEIMQNEY